MSYDIFYGKVTLPDGRICEATVHGVSRPDTWDEPGYFELDEDWPLEIDSIDGGDFNESEYEREYIVDDRTVTLSEFVIDYLLEHGEFEMGGLEYD